MIPKAVAAHPELEKMSARLATLIERTTSTLTTRRDEIPFSRTGIDLQTMRALRRRCSRSVRGTKDDS